MQLIIFRATQFRRIHLLQSSSTCSTLLRMVLTLARPGSFFTYVPRKIAATCIYFYPPGLAYNWYIILYIQVWLPHANTLSCWEAIPHSTGGWPGFIQINPIRDKVNLRFQGKEFMKRSPGSISKSDPSTVPAVDLTGVSNHFSFEFISYRCFVIYLCETLPLSSI